MFHDLETSVSILWKKYSQDKWLESIYSIVFLKKCCRFSYYNKESNVWTILPLSSVFCCLKKYHTLTSHNAFAHRTYSSMTLFFHRTYESTLLHRRESYLLRKVSIQFHIIIFIYRVLMIYLVHVVRLFRLR